jgi:hypothetical protein
MLSHGYIKNDSDVNKWAAPEFLEQAARELLEEEWKKRTTAKLPQAAGTLESGGRNRRKTGSQRVVHPVISRHALFRLLKNARRLTQNQAWRRRSARLTKQTSSEKGIRGLVVEAILPAVQSRILAGATVVGDPTAIENPAIWKSKGEKRQEKLGGALDLPAQSGADGSFQTSVRIKE